MRFWQKCVIISMMAPWAAYAQVPVVPGSADPARIETETPILAPEAPAQEIAVPEEYQGLTIPENAESIRFTLRDIRVNGVSAFSEEQIRNIYSAMLDSEISLDQVWVIANNITNYYRGQGYFLSRAYVPRQSFDDGVVSIDVVEGYIGEVELDGELNDYWLVRQLMQAFTEPKPVSALFIESTLLRLNDLPGVSFVGTLKPLPGGPEGAVKLVLQSGETEGRGLVSFDNYGSRFLGPYQGAISYQDSYIPLQQTTISGSLTAETDELRFVSLAHEIPLYNGLVLEVSGNYVDTQPGASLEVSDIQSDSVGVDINLTYTPIRQRLENLSISLGVAGQNTNGDFAGNTPLTRDRIRKARLGLNYDASDFLGGYNTLNVEITRGLEVLGSSDQGDLNLSREQAVPDFTKVNVSYSRQQALFENVVAIGQVSGQYSDDPLFSAEEFGYGGQRFGRAYDPSEITGDQGVAASLELRYQGIEPNDCLGLSCVPFVFYDAGKVWNEDTTGAVDESAMSAGLGVLLEHNSGAYGSLGVAFPLTRDVDNPLYGNGKSPRYAFQVGYRF